MKDSKEWEEESVSTEQPEEKQADQLSRRKVSFCWTDEGDSDSVIRRIEG
jgi:hypothetical protein